MEDQKTIFKRKITVLNSLALAPLIYTSSVINTPKTAISEINNTIQTLCGIDQHQKSHNKHLYRVYKMLASNYAKVKARKLCWVKRLCCNNNATWTILPHIFYKCSKLNILFSRNHVLPLKLNIPRFYTDVYNLYIGKFKKEPLTTVETLNKSLWHNSFLNSNSDTLFLKSWSNKGINKIKHIINEQGQFLCHNQLKVAYNIDTQFLTTIQIRSSIPKAWKELLRNFDKKYINISSEDKDIIHLVNREKAQDNITCADFYCLLIETKTNINQITLISVVKSFQEFPIVFCWYSFY